MKPELQELEEKLMNLCPTSVPIKLKKRCIESIRDEGKKPSSIVQFPFSQRIIAIAASFIFALTLWSHYENWLLQKIVHPKPIHTKKTLIPKNRFQISSQRTALLSGPTYWEQRQEITKKVKSM